MLEKYIVPEYKEKSNCSTILIGKDATVTGKVILAHNEDDTEAVVATHLVPRIVHKPGEFITLADGSAKIPQVEETYSYYWSEVRCDGGISFADGYANEFGLVVVSNASRPSKDPTGCKTDNREIGGIGYGIRRLVAERARNAREAVEVAAYLVEEFGYFSSRNYEFADKDEAWVFQVAKGHNFVARRVGDDEVYYMPNWYTIHDVDFSDTEHKKFYWSKDIVENAIKNGWYTPAKEGDWSDFDFAKTYQDNYDNQPEYNVLRARNAWKLLMDVDLKDDELKPFSMKAAKKYSRADIKKVLRSHYEGTPDDKSNGYEKNPHRGYYAPTTICNRMTVESIIVEFNEDINLTRMLRCSPRPCVGPYIPWYPVALSRIPRGYEWIGPLASQAAHFAVDKSELQYDPAKAWWAFRLLQYFTEFDYKKTHKKVHEAIRELEAEWEKEKDGVEGAYKAILATDPEAAKEVLTGDTCAQAQKAWDWAHYMVSKLGEERIYENCAEWGEFDN